MKKLISVLSALSLCFSILTCGCAKKEAISDSSEAVREMTTAEIVADMGCGINLGNTFEACGSWIGGQSVTDYETAWGSPVITEKTIKAYAEAGFGVLRIPVAWSNLMSDDGSYKIADEYLKRVSEVAGWALDAGMYAIVNLHWDNGWLNEFPADKEKNMAKYSAIWTQVCDEFKDRGDHLMFESQNEELGGWDSLWNRWSGSSAGKAEAYGLVNEINQCFVDIVRASGGNNAKRHLLISGYTTDVELTCDELFKMPTDPAGRMAVSVHYYTPSTLTVIDKDQSWGKARTTWGDEADFAELNRLVGMVKERFIDNGIPVIVGEYGCFGANKPREIIELYEVSVAKAFADVGACPVLWDTCGDEMDRETSAFRRPEFIAGLIEATKRTA